MRYSRNPSPRFFHRQTSHPVIMKKTRLVYARTDGLCKKVVGNIRNVLSQTFHSRGFACAQKFRDASAATLLLAVSRVISPACPGGASAFKCYEKRSEYVTAGNAAAGGGRRRLYGNGTRAALIHVLSGKRERLASRCCFNFKGAVRPFRRFNSSLQRRRC